MVVSITYPDTAVRFIRYLKLIQPLAQTINRINDSLSGDVAVIRYEGPKVGPGMPEILSPTAILVGKGLITGFPPSYRTSLVRT